MARLKTVETDPFDVIDQQILALLRRDGRSTSRQIADAVAVSEREIRDRLKRLEDEKLARVTLMLDHRVEGYTLLAAIGIKVCGRLARTVGQELAQNHRVSIVMLTSGPYDLEIQVFARDLDDLDQVVADQIAVIAGVGKVAVGVARQITKYEYQWVPFA